MASKFEINVSKYFPEVSSIDFPTIASARAEYSRLRKIAAKRLQRLEKAGLSESATYQRYADSFVPLPKGISETKVRKRLYEVARFLSLKGSTVTGEREKVRATIETLHDLGYDFINEENIGAFGRFMDAMSEYMGNKSPVYSSQAIDVFGDAWEDGEVDPEDLAQAFSDWLLADKDPDDFVYKPEKKQEPIPGEVDRQQKKPRGKSAVRKRADKNKERAERMKRRQQRRRK